LKREFLIDRQGKTFALYAGLLDEAHQNGLKSIRTRVLQAPTPENGDTTICVAEVEMGDGRVFSGIGDANPQNVGRNIAAHAIRMAETRAKARALRDAINVGTVALEELGDEDSDVESRPPRRTDVESRNADSTINRPAPTPIGPRGNGRPSPPAAATASTGELATPAQVRAIYLIARDQHGLSEETVDERARGLYGAKAPELTRRQASSFIDKLKGESTPAAS
jgi:hypothetical protein